MSFSKSTRAYVRFDRKSIQGTITLSLLATALIMGMLLLANYVLVVGNNSRQQQLVEVWLPTQQKLNRVEVYLKTGYRATDSYKGLQNELNTLSDQWHKDAMVVYMEELNEQLEQYLYVAPAAEGVEYRQLLEYKRVAKLLERMQQEASVKVQELEAQSAGFTTFLRNLLFFEYAFLLVCGFFICVIMVRVIARKIRKLKKEISEISQGRLPETIAVENDEFQSTGTTLISLVANLKHLTHFAGEVGRGNLDTSINAFDAESDLGRSLSEMRDSLRRVALEDKNRRWFNEGVAKFAEITRLHNGNVNDLCSGVIGELVSYVGALQGAIFITQKEENTTVLRMCACYAYDRQKYLDKLIPADSGLIGQAYLEKAPKYLTEIPKNYETITTGLGHGSPESILMVPLLQNERVEGVLELASLRKFHEHELEFLNKVTESMGAAIAAVRISEETRRLLEESQGVTEELRAQEEEMRQNMEEMQATQEEMARAQRQLVVKETNLNAFINNTTDSIITITRDYKVGLINEVQRARYKGTQYEGIDEGADVLPTLGAVAEEWKGYYDRAFAGERLDFTIKSSVKGEDAWRQYVINPIKAKNGSIVAASVTSRDVTERVKQEISLQQKSAILDKVVEHKADAYLALNLHSKVILGSKTLQELVPEVTHAPKEGELLLDLITAQATEEWSTLIKSCLQGKQERLIRVTSDGEKVELKFYPIYSRSKEVIALLILAAKRA